MSTGTIMHWRNHEIKGAVWDLASEGGTFVSIRFSGRPEPGRGSDDVSFFINPDECAKWASILRNMADDLEALRIKKGASDGPA